MIKPEDLRIGDLVRVNRDYPFPDGTLCTIAEIQDEKASGDENGFVVIRSINDDDASWWAWCNDIEGISLTPELLEKNGFKEEQHQKEGTSEWYDYYHYDLGINVVYEVDENKFAAYLDGKKLREIKCVHELQHILWALGLNAELEVKDSLFLTKGLYMGKDEHLMAYMDLNMQRCAQAIKELEG